MTEKIKFFHSFEKKKAVFSVGMGPITVLIRYC